MLRSFDYAAAAAIVERTAPDSDEARRSLRLRRRVGGRQSRRLLERVPRGDRLDDPVLPEPGPVAGAPPRVRGPEGRLRDRVRARTPAGLGRRSRFASCSAARSRVTIDGSEARPTSRRRSSRCSPVACATRTRSSDRTSTATTMRIRAFHPEATAASVARPDGVTPMRRLNAVGLFEVDASRSATSRVPTSASATTSASGSRRTRTGSRRRSASSTST